MGLKKISRLSNDFYQDYSDEKYEQILKKENKTILNIYCKNR